MRTLAPLSDQEDLILKLASRMDDWLKHSDREYDRTDPRYNCIISCSKDLMYSDLYLSSNIAPFRLEFSFRNKPNTANVLTAELNMGTYATTIGFPFDKIDLDNVDTYRYLIDALTTPHMVASGYYLGLFAMQAPPQK